MAGKIVSLTLIEDPKNRQACTPWSGLRWAHGAGGTIRWVNSVLRNMGSEMSVET